MVRRDNASTTRLCHHKLFMLNFIRFIIAWVQALPSSARCNSGESLIHIIISQLSRVLTSPSYFTAIFMYSLLTSLLHLRNIFQVDDVITDQYCDRMLANYSSKLEQVIAANLSPYEMKQKMIILSSSSTDDILSYLVRYPEKCF